MEPGRALAPKGERGAGIARAIEDVTLAEIRTWDLDARFRPATSWRISFEPGFSYGDARRGLLPRTHRSNPIRAAVDALRAVVADGTVSTTRPKKKFLGA